MSLERTISIAESLIDKEYVICLDQVRPFLNELYAGLLEQRALLISGEDKPPVVLKVDGSSTEGSDIITDPDTISTLVSMLGENIDLRLMFGPDDQMKRRILKELPAMTFLTYGHKT